MDGPIGMKIQLDKPNKTGYTSNKEKTMKSPEIKQLHTLLSEFQRSLPGKRIFLSVGNTGEDNIVLEMVDKHGDVIEGVCPLVEITPDGELVEQKVVLPGEPGISRCKSLGPIEALCQTSADLFDADEDETTS